VSQIIGASGVNPDLFWRGNFSPQREGNEARGAGGEVLKEGAASPFPPARRFVEAPEISKRCNLRSQNSIQKYLIMCKSYQGLLET